MINLTVGKYRCYTPTEEEYPTVESLLLDVIPKNSSENINERERRKLRNNIKFYDCLLCVNTETGEPIGTCLYRKVNSVYELVHMLVLPEYRITKGSALLNYALINSISGGREIYLKSKDISTFSKVIDHVHGDIYQINDRAREGLERYIGKEVK